MSNRTLYVRPEDEATWDKAKRLILIHEGVSLSQHLSDHIRQVVGKYDAIPLPVGRADRLLLDALKASRAVLTSILGTEAESRMIADQVALIDAAIGVAEAAA